MPLTCRQILHRRKRGLKPRSPIWCETSGGWRSEIRTEHSTRGADMRLRRELMPERLERAIGVIYRPETELQRHYFHAVLPRQFDEWIWFDETRAVEPLGVEVRAGMPETYPFAV